MDSVKENIDKNTFAGYSFTAPTNHTVIVTEQKFCYKCGINLEYTTCTKFKCFFKHLRN